MTRSVPPAPTGSTRPARNGLSAHRLGLYVLFASLTVLFAATVVAFLITRTQTPVWRTPEMPRLPHGLWVSTGLVFAISASFQSALYAVRRNQVAALVRRVGVGIAMAALFLFTQLQN
ncbi:MAG TPA: hypothetical protein VFQ35_22505, partial [Polyangiaceae bacterium]|nr:hypothetical protein [Polyangiaceae bacterium]